MPFYKKHLRLPSADYIGRGTYFVTLGTESRAKFFADLPTGQWLLEKLLALAAEFVGALFGRRVAPEYFFWGLHVGIFVVFFPAVLVAQKRVGSTNRKDFWKVVTKGSPDGLRYLLNFLSLMPSSTSLFSFFKHLPARLPKVKIPPSNGAASPATGWFSIAPPSSSFPPHFTLPASAPESAKMEAHSNGTAHKN